MYKIYLLVLLFFSMNFAAFTVEGNEGDRFYKEYTPSFWIVNKGSSEVKGFKIYIFIDVHQNMNNGEYPFNDELSISEPVLHGGKMSVKRMSAWVYRVTIDYSNVKIAAGGRFPAKGKYVTFNAYSDNISPYKVASQGAVFGNFVIENLSKKVLFGTRPSFKEKAVGLLKSFDYFYRNHNNSGYDADFILDVEDSNNRTGVKNKTDPNPPGITFLGGKIQFSYYPQYYEKLPEVPFDYVVLRLDTECPEGAYPFRRRHDTEDSHNANTVRGPIWPNKGGDNIAFEYCFMPKKEKAKLKYPFEKEFGVFAKYSAQNILHTELYVDDEDDDNNNSWHWYDTPESIQKRVKEIMYGSSNTTYHMIRWNGFPLKKSSPVNEVPVSSESPLVAAVPLAPAIKGLNRSIVSVELKSAGDVKVSVVGINGAVLANVTEKSLQPGDHQIKWNSGMVPSGRYIVKIEQNGMVNAKNVILK